MTGYSRTKMSRRRGKYPGPGWATFDRLYRQEKGLESDSNSEPFPTLASSKPSTTMGLAGYHRQSKSFSSFIQTSTEFTPQINECQNGVANNDSATGQAGLPTARLKNVHVWADDDLILDILAAANNDELQASNILSSMAPLESNTVQRDTPKSGVFLNSMLSEKESGDPAMLAALVTEEPEFESSLLPKLSLLVEPEWEEVDDDYLNHRKDALKMMRSASRHSKAASSAYMRGDHTSARQLSAQAQSEWLAAEKLNAEASKEILRIRNSDNDMWRLDLHGLHASEAVHALKRHLHEIESMQLGSGPSEGTSKFMTKGCPSNGYEKVNGYKQPQLKRQTPSNLHVITGTGNHSRGQAALPTAIRTFLIDNDYRFEEARPGVLAVGPKFRRN